MPRLKLGYFDVDTYVFAIKFNNYYLYQKRTETLRDSTDNRIL